MIRPLSIVLVLFITTHSIAQRGVAPSTTTPALNRSTDVPSGITPVGTTGRYRLNFRNATLDTVLYELAEAFGFSVIQVSPMGNERVGSIVNLTGVSESDAITLINVALNELDYAAIRKGNVLQIQRRSDAIIKNIPVRRFASPDEVPLNDELVTAVVPLRSANATQIANSLRPLIGSNTTLTADPSSNALIVTDVTSVIHRIVSIASELDSHSSSATAMQVFKLEHANPADVARVINELYRERPTVAANRGGVQPSPAAGPTRGGRGNRGG